MLFIFLSQFFFFANNKIFLELSHVWTDKLVIYINNEYYEMSGGYYEILLHVEHVPSENVHWRLIKTAYFVVSETANHVTVYHVCSESSMFVSKRRLILKTCGTTTPLQCLEPLLELVEEYTGFDDVEVNIIICRKNIMSNQQRGHVKDRIYDIYSVYLTSR